MIASIKLELWFLDSVELLRLDKDEPLKGRGALVHLFAYLRRQHHAIGNRATLSKVACECRCDEDWLWRIITDYGLFVVMADGTFYSPYLRQTLGMSSTPDEPSPLRTRKRRRALYSEDNDNSNNRENSNTPSACVCRNDTQHEALDSPQPPQYLGYDRVVDGCRYGYRGEPIPDDAPEQTSQDTRWSWRRGRWIPRAQWHEKQEKKQYELTTKQQWQTINGQ